jgi:hypothetical protein
MRMPRMTTRRWAIVIATVAGILAAADFHKRRIAWRAFCAAKVDYHARLAWSWGNVRDGSARTARKEMELAKDTSLPDKKRRWFVAIANSKRRYAKYIGAVAEYHVQMSDKYQAATNSLWLHAEPDPPEP